MLCIYFSLYSYFYVIILFILYTCLGSGNEMVNLQKSERVQKPNSFCNVLNSTEVRIILSFSCA